MGPLLRLSRGTLAGGVLLVVGCRDLAPPMAPPAQPKRLAVTALECEAQREPAAIRCGPSGPTVMGVSYQDAAREARARTHAQYGPWRGIRDIKESQLVFGGVGDRVLMDLQLTGFITSGPDAPYMRYALRLTNRLGQPLGTTNGTTADPDGVRVVFDNPTFRSVVGTQTPPDTLRVLGSEIRTYGAPTVTVPLGDETFSFEGFGDDDGVLRPAESAIAELQIRWQPGISRAQFRLLVAAAVPDAGDGMLTPPAAWSSIALGGGHGCAIQVEGTVYCWGDNTSAQLGATNGLWAVQNTLFGWPTNPSIGEDFQCQLNARPGRVWCAGIGDVGQTGNGPHAPFVSVVQINMQGDTANARMVATGVRHACLLTERQRRILCWGASDLGQAGAVLAQPTLPREVNLGSWLPDTLVAGRDFTCALRYASGETRCWGANSQGQLGLGTTSASVATPTVLGISGQVRRLGAGDDFACALFDAAPSPNVVRCWGRGAEGQLGNGLFVQNALPQTVTGVTGDGLVVGARHACALSASVVSCWGDNRGLQLGITSGPYLATAQASALPGADAIGGAAGDEFTCVAYSAGDVRCAGTNRGGPLGSTPTSTVNELLATESGPPVLAARARVLCVYVDQQSPRCSGESLMGMLGEFGTRPRVEGVRVGVRFTKLSVGERHTCGITADSSAYCWGEGLDGALGTGDEDYVVTPQLVVLPGGPWKVADIAAGDRFTCATINQGDGPEVACWGRNTDGQVGVGSSARSVLLPQVLSPTGGGWRISAGAGHVCQWDTGGNAPNPLVCWGRNAHGQLGVGDTTNRTVPVPVVAPGPIDEVALGRDFSCLVTEFGGGSYTDVSCVGRNDLRQLGQFSATPRSTSYLQLGLDQQGVAPSVVALVAGRAHACAVVGDPDLFNMVCWGDSSAGQLLSNSGALGPVIVDGFSTQGSSAQPVLAANFASDATCSLIAPARIANCWGGGNNARSQLPIANRALPWSGYVEVQVP